MAGSKAPLEMQVGVDVVLFDYGQVLSLPPDPVTWTRMQEIIGLSNAQLHDAYWKFRDDYDRDILGGEAYWSAVARQTGIELTHAQIEALLSADVDLWGRPNQPMIEWARQLQRAGIRTAILSNIGDAMAAGVTARLKWLKDFERCIWSYALKLAKPDPEIFAKTAALLKTLPERILFIDDKEENAEAARGAGMKAVRYSTQEKFEVEMKSRSWLKIGRSD